MIKAILFDLDGTLIDTREFIFQAYEHALKKHGLESVTREVLSPQIGGGLANIYQEIAPTGNIQNLVDSHVSFQNENFHLVQSFPNISSVLDSMKKLGYKIGIVTSRLKNTPQALIAAGVNNEFDVIVTADDVQKSKPDPEGIFLALEKLNIKPSEAIFVGDASVDIQMGKNAKVKTIGATYGFGGEAIKKSSPDYVASNFPEVYQIVSKFR